MADDIDTLIDECVKEFDADKKEEPDTSAVVQDIRPPRPPRPGTAVILNPKVVRKNATEDDYRIMDLELDGLLNDDTLSASNDSFVTRATESTISIEGSSTDVSAKLNDMRVDDVDDLLNDELLAEEDPYALQDLKFPTNTNGEQKECNPVQLTGCAVKMGFSTIPSPKACDNLHCVNCDFKVIAFDNYKWHPSTDYYFLRSHMPDFEKLKSRLQNCPGTRAYACQCYKRSVEFDVNLQSEKLTWICAKHDPEED